MASRTPTAPILGPKRYPWECHASDEKSNANDSFCMTFAFRPNHAETCANLSLFMRCFNEKGRVRTGFRMSFMGSGKGAGTPPNKSSDGPQKDLAITYGERLLPSRLTMQSTIGCGNSIILSLAFVGTSY